MDHNFREMRAWRPAFPLLTTLLSVLPIATLTFFIIWAFVPVIGDGAFLSASDFSSDLIRIGAFTTTQAGISAAAVALFSLPIALTLVAAGSRVRNLVIFCGLMTYCLPSGLIANGIIYLLGRSGVISRMLQTILPEANVWQLLYSKWIVIAVNVLMNAPFAGLLVFQSIRGISSAQWQTARILGLKTISCLRFIVLPSAYRSILLAATLTFLLSMNSFGAVTLLGSGPANETLEFSVYTRYFNQGDRTSSAIFALTHMLICAVVVGALTRLKGDPARHKLNVFDTSLDSAAISAALFRSRVFRIVMLAIAVPVVLVSLAPIIAIISHGILAIMNPNTGSESLTFLLSATRASLTQSLPVAVAVVLASWLIARAASVLDLRGQKTLASALMRLPYSGTLIPGMTLAFGAHIFLNAGNLHVSVSPTLLIMATHIILTLPVALSVILPEFERFAALNSVKYLLGISALKWLSVVEFPTMARSLLIALMVALAFSVNETAITTVLRPPEDPALSSAILQLAGHYRFDDAAIGSLFVIIVTAVAITSGLFFIGGEKRDA